MLHHQKHHDITNRPIIPTLQVCTVEEVEECTVEPVEKCSKEPKKNCDTVENEVYISSGPDI